jgi:hypothetical protein
MGEEKSGVGLRRYMDTKMEVKQIDYRGWKNAYKISNHTVELIVTADVGPRILFYGLEGENEFCELSEECGKTGGTGKRLYGGHRLWLAPENDETFFPDNGPVEVDVGTQYAKFRAPVEKRDDGTAVQKEIELELGVSGTNVRITHRVRNCGDRNVSASLWAITMLREGGRAIVPLSPDPEISKEGCRPHCSLALWPGTNLMDPRLHLGRRHVEMIANSDLRSTSFFQKIGVHNAAGWAAYTNANHVFLKRATCVPGMFYTDLNSNIELYVQPGFLELETLGPYTVLAPGELCEHVEDWLLFENIPDYDGESWVETVLLPLLQPNL